MELRCRIAAKSLRILVAGALLPPALTAWTTSALAAGHDIHVTTSIQAAVDAAVAGDTIHVPAGLFHENVLISKDNIRIEANPEAMLDGTGTAYAYGIRVAPANPTSTLKGFTLHGLHVQNFRGTGVPLQHVSEFEVSGGDYRQSKIYSVFSLLSDNGIIARNTASGSNDTCIYVGESHDVALLDNHMDNCTIGIEVENSSNAVVRGNELRANSLGIIVDNVPGTKTVNTTDVQVLANWVIENNRPNPLTDPTDLASNLPGGVGILNVGADRVGIANNHVEGNNTAGIAVVQVPPAFASLDPRLDPLPDSVSVQRNVALNNGRSPDPRSPLPGVDLLWDMSGIQNCWSHNVFESSFPSPLPACG